MSSEEMGIEQARPVLGPIADRARYAGQVTYLTRNGRRIAAVVPLNRIKESVDLQAIIDRHERNVPDQRDRCACNPNQLPADFDPDPACPIHGDPTDQPTEGAPCPRP